MPLNTVGIFAAVMAENSSVFGGSCMISISLNRHITTNSEVTHSLSRMKTASSWRRQASSESESNVEEQLTASKNLAARWRASDWYMKAQSQSGDPLWKMDRENVELLPVADSWWKPMLDAPELSPKTVIRSGSPPNEEMWCLIQRSASSWSFRPKFPTRVLCYFDINWGSIWHTVWLTHRINLTVRGSLES